MLSLGHADRISSILCVGLGLHVLDLLWLHGVAAADTKQHGQQHGKKHSVRHDGYIVSCNGYTQAKTATGQGKLDLSGSRYTLQT